MIFSWLKISNVILMLSLNFLNCSEEKMESVFESEKSDSLYESASKELFSEPPSKKIKIVTDEKNFNQSTNQVVSGIEDIDKQINKQIEIRNDKKLEITLLYVIIKVLCKCDDIRLYIQNNKFENQDLGKIFCLLIKNDISDEDFFEQLENLYDQFLQKKNLPFGKTISTSNIIPCISDFMGFLFYSFHNNVRDCFENYFVFKFSFFISNPNFCELNSWRKDNLGVITTMIENGIVSVNSLVFENQISDVFTSDSMEYDFQADTYPKYLFTESYENISVIFKKYIVNDKFIDIDFHSRTYKILGFIFLNDVYQSIRYFHIKKESSSFSHFCIRQNPNEDGNGEFDLNDYNGKVIFVLEKK